MGVENFMDAPVEGKRKAKRARVLLAARLSTERGELDVRLRDLSRKGALIECDRPPAVGAEVVFTRGSTTVPARVAWAGANRVGLEFKYMIDESEVLVQLRRNPSEASQPRFRRPRLYGEDLTEHDRKLAQVWGLAVGIPVPGA
jgi:hypothetical protein